MTKTQVSALTTAIVYRINNAYKNHKGNGATIKAVGFDQDGQPSLWAIYDSHNNRFNNKNGQFDYEPLPSNRTDKWLAEHTFDSRSDALNCYFIYYK